MTEPTPIEMPDEIEQLEAAMAFLFDREISVVMSAHEWAGIVAACEIVCETMLETGEAADYLTLKGFTDKMWGQVLAQGPTEWPPPE